MALVTAQQLTAGPGEKEEKFVKTMEASSASKRKPSQAKQRRYLKWPNGQGDNYDALEAIPTQKRSPKRYLDLLLSYY